MTAPPSSSRRFNWPLAFTVLGLTAIAAGIFVFNRCAALPGRAARETVDQMERVGRDLRDAIVQITQLQPRVTINNRVYFEQTSPIAELALISRKLEVEHEFLHTWAGSTKRLRLHGTYTAKADLICARNSASRSRRRRQSFGCRTHNFLAWNKTRSNCWPTRTAFGIQSPAPTFSRSWGRLANSRATAPPNKIWRGKPKNRSDHN
jgi:hypothetical protein